MPCLWVDRVRRGPQTKTARSRQRRWARPRPGANPVSNGQMRRVVGPARVVVQLPGPPGSRSALAADRPGRHSFQHGCATVIQMSISRFSASRSSCPGCKGARNAARPPRRGSPRTGTPAGDPAVQFRPDLEAIVAVVLMIVDQPGYFVPDGAPGLAGKAESRGKAGRITERKIETDQYPLAVRPCRRQPFANEHLGLMPRPGVYEAFAVGAAPADPDAVLPLSWHFRRTPVDDGVMIEDQAGRWRRPGSVRAVSPGLSR